MLTVKGIYEDPILLEKVLLLAQIDHGKRIHPCHRRIMSWSSITDTKIIPRRERNTTTKKKKQKKKKKKEEEEKITSMNAVACPPKFARIIRFPPDPLQPDQKLLTENLVEKINEDPGAMDIIVALVVAILDTVVVVVVVPVKGAVRRVLILKVVQEVALINTRAVGATRREAVQKCRDRRTVEGALPGSQDPRVTVDIQVNQEGTVQAGRSAFNIQDPRAGAGTLPVDPTVTGKIRRIAALTSQGTIRKDQGQATAEREAENGAIATKKASLSSPDRATKAGLSFLESSIRAIAVEKVKCPGSGK